MSLNIILCRESKQMIIDANYGFYTTDEMAFLDDLIDQLKAKFHLSDVHKVGFIVVPHKPEERANPQA